MNVVFPEGDTFKYTVPVIKYWKYSDKDLINKKMYPLLPLQLFSLKQDIEKAAKKNDILKIKTLSRAARDLAEKLAYESKDLLDKNEIAGEDFHKLLLAIQNLIEYLSRNYLNDEELEEEVIKVTKTLYDPEVEKNGEKIGIEKTKTEDAKVLIRHGVSKDIIMALGLSEQRVAEFIEEVNTEIHSN